MPGRASSPRISSAMIPPARKKANEVTRYMLPMILWSVVRSRSRRTEPRLVGRTGSGRLTIGEGAVTVTRGLRRVDSAAATGRPRQRAAKE